MLDHLDGINTIYKIQLQSSSSWVIIIISEHMQHTFLSYSDQSTQVVPEFVCKYDSKALFTGRSWSYSYLHKTFVKRYTI
jgi:hypothetical protein